MSASEKELIRVEDLHKSFGSLQVLKGVTEHVNHGEVVSVIGPSGGGKSTFLRCLNLLETPTSGKIYFEGTDITDKDVDINLHRQKMGMVFQHFNLFPHKTILENITLAPIKLLKKDKAEAEKEARVCYLKDNKNVEYCDSKYTVLVDADAMILVTEWKEFRQPDFIEIKKRLKNPVIFDGRNQFDAHSLSDKGFEYYQIGVSSKLNK